LTAEALTTAENVCGTERQRTKKTPRNNSNTSPGGTSSLLTLDDPRALMMWFRARFLPDYISEKGAGLLECKGLLQGLFEPQVIVLERLLDRKYQEQGPNTALQCHMLIVAAARSLGHPARFKHSCFV